MTPHFDDVKRVWKRALYSLWRGVRFQVIAFWYLNVRRRPDLAMPHIEQERRETMTITVHVVPNVNHETILPKRLVRWSQK